MCRTVADSAILLSSIAGYDPEDGASADVPQFDHAKRLRANTSSFRLGKPRLVFYETAADARVTKLDAEIEAATNKALEVLGHLTAGVREMSLPPTPDLFDSVAAAEAYTFHALHLAETPELYQPQTRKDLQAGAKITIAQYMEGRRDLDRMRRMIASVFADVDLLVTPTMPRSPLMIAECLFRCRSAPENSISSACPQYQFVAGLRVRAYRSACRSSDRVSARPRCSRSRMPTSKQQIGTDDCL